MLPLRSTLGLGGLVEADPTLLGVVVAAVVVAAAAYLVRRFVRPR